MIRTLAAALAITITATPAAAAVGLKLFDSGYTAPVFVTGRANTLFVVEQAGRIVAVDRSSKVRTNFFQVPNIESGGEKGLLGLAFDPRYKVNGRFYVNVTARVNGQLVSEIRRYTDPSIATEAAQVVLRVDQPYENHNGGWIDFGPDKNLCVAFGDGGAGNDPQNNAQNKPSLLGKILRLDVSKDGFPADPLKNYAIPASNPFGSEVFAYGLRNPFRNSFDRTTGDLWIGDVGQGRYEEVNRIAAGTSGQNFGWRPLEGTLPTPGVGDAIPVGTTAPVTGYTHDNGDRSITGGYVYRGGGLAEIAGRYVFGDFISGRIWSVARDGSGLTELTGLAASVGGANWSSFGEDGNRGLYSVDYAGRIFRFVTPPALRSAAVGILPGSGAASAVPEPQSWAMMIAGFGVIGAGRRFQRRLQRRSWTTGNAANASCAASPVSPVMVA